MNLLQGASILISAGGDSLGQAIAQRCLDQGARVAVLEDQPARMAVLRETFGDALLLIEDAPTTLGGQAHALGRTLAMHGRLDAYVGHSRMADNGLGIAEWPDEASLSTGLDAILSADVKAYVYGAYIMRSALRESAGSMIFTLDDAALRASEGGLLYTVARHAGAGLVRQLALELAPVVRVNAVCAALAPRDRDTPFAHPPAVLAPPRDVDLHAPHYLPDAYAQAEHYIALLACKASLGVTGQFIEVRNRTGIEGLISLA